MRLVNVTAIAILATTLPSCSDEATCEDTLTCEASPSDEVAADRPNQTSSGDAGGTTLPSNGGNPSQGGNGNTPNTPNGGGGSTPMASGGEAGMSTGGNGATGGGLDGGAGGTAGTPSADAGTGGDIGVVIPVTRCAGPADCTAQAPVCDTALDRCVVCKLEDDSGCTDALPYCVGAGNDTAKCVECESEGDCGGATPLCGNNGACVACMTEADCSIFPSTPLCRTDGECVACLSENDCSIATPVCDDTGECAGCDDSSQCTHLPDTAECNTATGGCVECVGSAECTEPTAPRCAANACTGRPQIAPTWAISPCATRAAVPASNASVTPTAAVLRPPPASTTRACPALSTRSAVTSMPSVTPVPGSVCSVPSATSPCAARTRAIPRRNSVRTRRGGVGCFASRAPRTANARVGTLRIPRRDAFRWSMRVSRDRAGIVCRGLARDVRLGSM